jgi:hypothetical protein
MFGKILGIKEVDALGCFQLLHSRGSAGRIPHSVKRQSVIVHTKFQFLPH